MKKLLIVDVPDLREGEQIFVNYGNSETGYLVALRHKELTLPTEEEQENEIDKYAFRVPYDGSNNFYDEDALKHFKAGINWYRNEILKQLK